MKLRRPWIYRRVTSCVAITMGLIISLAACSAAPAVPEAASIEIRLKPSRAAIAVAQEEGLFENLDVTYTMVGYNEAASLFLASDDPIGDQAPWEAAKFISEGEDLVYFSTCQTLNFWNGVIIREADTARYESIEDLAGRKLGHPGLGTGTWQAFEILMRVLYGRDALASFELVQADPGALLGLLATGEIDGALNFGGQAATAMATSDLHLLFSFTEAWMEAEGYPLVINGWLARRDWIEGNLDAARRFVEGCERGLQWMKDNPEEFRPDGKYADWVAGEGWFNDEQTTDFIIDSLLAGDWYLSQDLYTQGWIDSAYRFVEQGKGVFADEVPAKDDLFFPPERLSSPGG